jgi:dynein regulatory complex protein 1
MEKFHELWIMNEERCKEMAQKLLDADRIIFEQQLGLTWTPKNLDFMNNIGPIDATKIPKPSIDVVREILTDQPDEDPVPQTASHLSNSSMKAILELLCDEGVGIIYHEEIDSQLFIYRNFLLNQNF